MQNLVIMRVLHTFTVLISSLFALSAAAAGCVGGDTDTGGGGSASTKDVTGGLPECGGGASVLVRGCVAADSFVDLPDTPVDIDVTGVVAAVRAPDPSEACGTRERYHFPIGRPAVMIDLTLGDGTSLTVGLEAPGFSTTSITQGETLGVRYHFDIVPADETQNAEGSLEITRDGATVAAIGLNIPAVLTPGEGEETCYRDTADSGCLDRHQAMEVTAADGTIVSIPEDGSADVDGYRITNDYYYEKYEKSACDWVFRSEYIMSAAAQ